MTPDRFEARVFAAFVEGGRLKQLPAKRKKRLVVLRWLADHFRPAWEYLATGEARLAPTLCR